MRKIFIYKKWNTPVKKDAMQASHGLVYVDVIKDMLKL